jgi:hypothetical protein
MHRQAAAAAAAAAALVDALLNPAPRPEYQRQYRSRHSGARTWYGADNQGSVRQTLSDSGAVLGTQNYDPYGTP